MRLPLISAAVLGASLLALPAPASAAQFAGFSASNLPVQAQSFDSASVEKVGYYRHYHHHGGNGGAVAAGAIIGLALGAIIASQASRYDRTVEWCMRRYRSYDPRTGTWVDYHGRIRYCP
jgi:hypothetical protein